MYVCCVCGWGEGKRVTLINVLWTLILLSDIIGSVVLMAVILSGACGQVLTMTLQGSFDLSPFSEPGKRGDLPEVAQSVSCRAGFEPAFS